MKATDASPESRTNTREQHRTRIVSAAVIGALLLVALVFHARLIAWFTGPANGGSTSKPTLVTAGRLSIDTAVQPDPPGETGNRAHVGVRDAQGNPVTGARVRLEYDMPAMGAMQAMHGGIDASGGRRRPLHDPVRSRHDGELDDLDSRGDVIRRRGRALHVARRVVRLDRARR